MIFSEVYGTYYNTVAKILNKALKKPITSNELYNCIIENAYSESVVPITDAIIKEQWQVLKFDSDKNEFTSVIKNNVKMPLTKLQLSYLKAIIMDKRIRLFDLDFEYFEKQLSEIEPLWNPGDYEVFDQYKDGDNFEDAGYKKRFKMIVEAKEKKLPLEFSFNNRYGKTIRICGIPKKIEYSEKDNKFRVMLDGNKEATVLNLGRIESIKFVQNKIADDYSYEHYNTDTIVLELTDERNALERVSMHFANLKKKTTKIESNKYKMEIEYNRDDETEMVIRLLQFGPVIKILEPEYVVDEIKRRLNMQLRLVNKIQK